MSKEKWLSILRVALTAAGAYLMGKHLLGTTIDNSVWLGVVGGIVTAASTIWGVADKTAGPEKIASGLRSVLTTFGSMMVGAGIIKDDVLKGALEAISIIVPTGLSETSKRLNENVATGKTAIVDLSGVDPKKVSITPNTTTIPTKDKK